MRPHCLTAGMGEGFSFWRAAPLTFAIELRYDGARRNRQRHLQCVCMRTSCVSPGPCSCSFSCRRGPR
ncbi:hypothetical protein CBM2586_B10018 [Cupriavidus phytorum]|uniref:Uncharacterized protein n=1 Tax=Cupriavidus taiwanensis TaxID=164546 RepID=A0A975XE37_9BURK|nr:hypothetical protein CBM2586_B10018 [Cupriavidus taiwanensis]